MTRPSIHTQRQREQAVRILRNMRAIRRKLQAMAAQNEAAWAFIDESLVEIDGKAHPEVGEALERIVREAGRG